MHTLTDVPTADVFDRAVPLQHQIYLQMRQEIADGLWTARTDFPGEKELARRFDVSVITTKAALNRLAEEGWVERRRGRGTRAMRLPPEPRPASPQLLAVGPRRDYRYQVIFAGEAVAPLAACRAFGMAPGSVLWQCSRLRRYENRPHSVTFNVQLPEVGGRHRPKDLGSRPMGAILASEGHVLARIHREFRATLAPIVAAGHLGITVSDPVLETVFTVDEPDGNVLEWVRIYLHPDEHTPAESMDLRTGAWSAREHL
jgi:GntR family transcriptional regulator